MLLDSPELSLWIQSLYQKLYWSKNLHPSKRLVIVSMLYWLICMQILCFQRIIQILHHYKAVCKVKPWQNLTVQNHNSYMQLQWKIPAKKQNYIQQISKLHSLLKVRLLITLIMRLVSGLNFTYLVKRIIG